MQDSLNEQLKNLEYQVDSMFSAKKKSKHINEDI